MATRTVHCVKLGKQAEGLASPPVPGELGQRVWNNVSQEAWTGWLAHQTMLINEYRLTPFDPETRQFLFKEMEKYFFGEGSKRPEGFVASDSSPSDSSPSDSHTPPSDSGGGEAEGT